MSVAIARNRLLARQYLDELCPFGLTDYQLAAYSEVDDRTVRRWRDGKGAPSRTNTHRLGQLAATLSFLRESLNWNEEEARVYMERVHIDPDTYQPTTMVDYVKRGDTSPVIQSAIESSIIT